MSAAGSYAGLLPAALAGDRGALRGLLDGLLPVAHRRVVARLARSGSRRHDPDDMTQEVILSLVENDFRALRAWDAGRGRSLESFVGMLADHAVVSILRNGRRTPWREEAWAPEDIDAHRAAPDARLEARMLSKSLLTRLADRLGAELSPRAWEVFVMLVVEERAPEEVADALHVDRSTVYSWRSRLAKRARELATELANEQAPRMALGLHDGAATYVGRERVLP